MRNSDEARNPRSLISICVVLFVFASVPFLSAARTAGTSVNIVNNSSKLIRNVYLSHVNADDWGSNQLGDSVISAGQSFNLNGIACDQDQVKVIAEDADGCFLSTVVSCGQTASWTITDDTSRDCCGH